MPLQRKEHQKEAPQYRRSRQFWLELVSAVPFDLIALLFIDNQQLLLFVMAMAR